MNANHRPYRPLRAGDKLYGFCGGAFGRDSFGEKTVEAIGRDWVVCREGESLLLFSGVPRSLAEYRTPEGKCCRCGQNPAARDAAEICATCDPGIMLCASCFEWHAREVVDEFDEREREKLALANKISWGVVQP